MMSTGHTVLLIVRHPPQTISSVGRWAARPSSSAQTADHRTYCLPHRRCQSRTGRQARKGHNHHRPRSPQSLPCSAKACHRRPLAAQEAARKGPWSWKATWSWHHPRRAVAVACPARSTRRRRRLLRRPCPRCCSARCPPAGSAVAVPGLPLSQPDPAWRRCARRGSGSLLLPRRPCPRRGCCPTSCSARPGPLAAVHHTGPPPVQSSAE